MEPEALFPLPLSPIEICWLLEDCPSHPMQFFLRLEINGKLEKKSFESAVQKTIRRHPLFTAIVEQVSRTKWQWIAGPDERLPVIWKIGNPQELPPAEPLDIFKERGLRVTVIEDNTRTAIFLQFQHTVCDGLSASDFGGDLMTAYAEKVEPENTYKYKRLDSAKLKVRDATGLPKKELNQWYRKSLKSLVKFHRFYKRKPVLLLNKKRPPEDDPMALQPQALFKRFSKSESVSINKKARESETNLNGHLLATMFTAFLQWRGTREQNRDDALFRVTTPMSLRGANHRAIPAANIVGLVCFDRPISETKNSSDLVKWINQQIKIVQDEHRGLILPMAIKLLKWWPEQLAAGIRRKRFSGTTLLSNLGPILTNCHLPRTDGKIRLSEKLVVEQAEFLAVLRPGHCATMAASSYAGELTLAMHFDERMISQEEAEELFAGYNRSILT